MPTPIPPPEPVLTRLSPDEIRLRLDELRSRYEHGAITQDLYKGLCGKFRFRDAAGYLWSIGAASSRWYRWDLTAWTDAEPPAELYFSDETLEDTPAWLTTERAANEPAAPHQYRCACGVVTEKPTKFCPECGAPRSGLRPSAPPAPAPVSRATAQPQPQRPVQAAPPPPPAQVAANPSCPKCGRPINPNHKFCRACGYQIG